MVLDIDKILAEIKEAEVSEAPEVKATDSAEVRRLVDEIMAQLVF